MAYCTIDDVKAINPKRTYDASSKPSITQVEEFITQCSNEMDSRLLARGLSVPITEPAAFVSWLKKINAAGGGYMAEWAMFPEAAGTPGGSPHGQYLYKEYKDGLDRLDKGDLPTSVQGRVGPMSTFEQETEEPTEEWPWKKPKFRKDKQF